MKQDKDVRQFFFPQVVVQIKALACELPWESGIALSRFSNDEIASEVIKRGIVASISGATVWRWLNEDAIKPWQHRSWIFPRDPEFREKAVRILDLYHGIWDDKHLSSDEYIISADEKTSIQARIRKHATQPPKAYKCMRVEHEYKRGGALNYLAAWDVRRAKVFGRCEPKTGIVPFGRLVDQVMTQEPYCSAERVFWIVDNGSSHRGESSVERLQKMWSNIVVVHLPVHASWLNQVEIYFSIIQRKVLTPNDFSSLDEVKSRLFQFQERYEQIAKPFEWKFTRDDLSKMLSKIPSELDSFWNKPATYSGQSYHSLVLTA
jgi:hypothetical protein